MAVNTPLMAKAFHKLQVDEALTVMMAGKYDASGQTGRMQLGKWQVYNIIKVL